MGENQAAPAQLAEILSRMSSTLHAAVFADLRNRREGTDLAECVSQLELTNE